MGRRHYAPWRIILLFQVLSLGLVFLLQRDHISVNLLYFSAGLILLTLLSNWLVVRFTSGDHYILPIANMLFSIGVIVIYRIDPYYGQRQLLFYALGIVFFFLVYGIFRVSGNFWKNYTWFFYGVTLALLLVTMVFGVREGGAKNWLSIAGFTFQPAELAKLTLVLFVAGFFANERGKLRKQFGSFLLLAAAYVLIGIFFLQRELGTALVFFAVILGSQVAFDNKKSHVFIHLVVAVLGGALAFTLFSHLRVRIDIWLNPWADVMGKGYQITQSLFAIASGSFFGTGIGLGRPETIPLAWSDFIYASILEEMGLFMGVALVLLYLILFYRGMKVALDQKSDFYQVLALSISILLASQAMIIIGGVLKLIPLTGITLPLVAYGGSSVLSCFGLLGMLQYCSEEEGYDEAR